MAKPTVRLPATYIAKMQKVLNAGLTAQVIARFPIKKSTWHSVLNRKCVSQPVLDALNPFFSTYGCDKDQLSPLDWEELKYHEMTPLDHRERSDCEAVHVARLKVTGDTWHDIRTLYLDRRNADALALAQWGLHSSSIETKLASAQSLIYLNHRFGRISALAIAVNELRRTAAEHPKLFSRADRIRAATDIAKCLAEQGHPRMAAPLFDEFEELCRSSSNLMPAHIRASLMRGVSECRYFRHQVELAHRNIKYAAELARDGQATGDDLLSHANAVVLYSSPTQRSSKSFDRDWSNLAEDLERLQRCLAESAHLESAEDVIPPGVSLATLLVVLVTSAFSAPELNEKGTWDLIDTRAEWLFRAGLADDKILPYGIGEQFLKPIPIDRPGRQILASMVKNRLRDDDAKALDSFARELLQSNH